jgi:hypothetical protein
MRSAIEEGGLPLRYPIRGTFSACCASAISPKASTTIAIRIDSAVAFFISYLVRVLLIRLIEEKKSVIYDGKRPGFAEGKYQIQPQD